MRTGWRPSQSARRKAEAPLLHVAGAGGLRRLFPIDWPEPFGLVMIEAMACGTPVLAFRCGSVPEIVEDGLTGRIVSSVDEAVQAIPELLALDRKVIRTRFENGSPHVAWHRTM
jgi:glycosyltransferase involved in cell wall biosynthesis